ncbi:hypothetical protein PLICRDRAFT_171775 [Plicaturopsis crispa FD-325 SS-3]|nr:hypothetical protein PLICRDRAFT_171775 [Plicaturopsis crispa FD-325 SS-3]
MALAHVNEGALQDILGTAKRLSDSYGSRQLLVDVGRQITPSLGFDLLPMPDRTVLETALSQMGLPAVVVQRTSKAFLRVALEMRTFLHDKLESAMQSLQGPSVPALRQGLRSTFVIIYRKQLDQWISKAVSSATSKLPYRMSIESAKSPKSTKPAFNNEYVPVLEYYFQHNAFPSHADRMFLAHKSSMNHEQIYVWFQNRRRKHKERTGIQLKKEDFKSSKPMQSMEPMMGRMPTHLVIPEEERKPYVDSDVTEYEIEYDSSDVESSVKYVPSRDPEAVDVFNTPAPPHAFPTNYPPPPELNPFPIKSGVRNFPAPEWRRRLATKPIKHAPVDIAKLTDAFAKMQVKYTNFARTVRKDKDNIRGKKRRTTPPVAKPDRAAATAAITTQVPPAPLPAFVRRTEFLAPRRQRPVPAPTVPAPASRLHPFRSPSPTAQPATLVPSARLEAETPTPRRKVAGLPKRTPTGSSRAHRGVSSASSVSSIGSPRSSPSRSLDSRTSSFTSTVSSQRVSSGSSFASEANTPDASFSALPEVASSASNPFSQFDFTVSSPSMTDLFGDSVMDSLFPGDATVGAPQWQYGVRSNMGTPFLHAQKSPSFNLTFGAAPMPAIP